MWWKHLASLPAQKEEKPMFRRHCQQALRHLLGGLQETPKGNSLLSSLKNLLKCLLAMRTTTSNSQTRALKGLGLWNSLPQQRGGDTQPSRLCPCIYPAETATVLHEPCWAAASGHSKLLGLLLWLLCGSGTWTSSWVLFKEASPWPLVCQAWF